MNKKTAPKNGHPVKLGKIKSITVTEVKTPKPKAPMSAAEALFGFTAWLTTRPVQLKISDKDDCSVLPELIGKFVDTNGLAPARAGWEKNLTHPTESFIGCYKPYSPAEAAKEIVETLNKLSPRATADVLTLVKNEMYRQQKNAERNADANRRDADNALCLAIQHGTDLNGIFKND